MTSMPRPSPAAAGFTLIELLVVMLVLGLLLGLALPNYLAATDRARDVALRENLRVMRVTLDQFAADRGRRARSLDELVQAGYLKAVPADPITGSTRSWVEVMAEHDPADGATAGGLADVRSGAAGSNRDGRPYSVY